ncbi:sugar transferase [Candidatus Stoquefichus massiliensis]|uniref:sugar transferase n=1 Tax=Candidatus Stoquefichus massiliensis TaxID=1470350 RepID=UPI002A4E115E|nr:sugar transferase [Candidatus Stoquefichus massiliensis]
MKKWEDLPEYMQTDEVRPYYEILRKKKFQLILKRLFDIIVSFILIILLSPVILFFSIWIKIDSKGTVFYRQERVTQYGRIFKIFKFRTMISDADQIGNLVTSKNDSRITRVGEKIRKYRIDEIPQLFNVLIGDMSFVGTRPEVKKYVDQYTNEMYATLLLPAGVTSLASIQFKDEDEIIEKYVSQGRETNEVYINEVLPLKMKYNLDAMTSFYFMKDISVMINTVVKV